MNAFIVELPNRPGSLAMISEAIAERGINISGIAGATSGELGSVAFITDDESATRNALGEKGWVYREVPVVTASLDDQPGTLAAAARRLADAGINVETMFVTGKDGDKVKIAFGVDTPEAAQRALG
ncbi:MAG TPA: ACT domain-containing protein [Candidatus Limnocylindria bacterium]